MSPAGRKISSGYDQVAATENGRGWIGIALFVGAVVLASVAWRIGIIGLDNSAVWAIVVVAGLTMLALPIIVRHLGLRLPQSIADRLPAGPRLLMMGVATVLAGAGWLYYVSPHLPGDPSAGGNRTPATAAIRPNTPPAAAALSGRAAVLDGQTLRLDGAQIRLAGLEAPERAQRCTRGGRPWRCGEAARTALEKLVRGKQVRCTAASRDDGAGRMLATCTVDSIDLGDHLVRQGHVFSTSTLFGGYASAEREARSAGRGLWSGEAERPSEFRVKKWDEARANAPDGCPIKGLVTGSGRSYVMPWASDYSTRKVRVSRGERWFCSEQDAAAAGFKPAGRG